MVLSPFLVQFCCLNVTWESIIFTTFQTTKFHYNQFVFTFFKCDKMNSFFLFEKWRYDFYCLSETVELVEVCQAVGYFLFTIEKSGPVQTTVQLE